MNTQIRKADSGTNRKGFLQNHLIAGGNQKTFSTFDYRQKRHSGQCKRCGSDYMKFAYNDYCQDCQQRVEFILREHPEVLTQAKNNFREATT
jgi:hypothetical protein